ncbi:MAG: class I SAM-dependent methyltransferase [Limnobacter sp.]|nr:class I SAM-dependent methyltransferase [Limnobacter sp.]
MESDFKQHPQQVGDKDYWAQVKRTVNGQPVSEDDIRMITDAIRYGLDLKPGQDDRLLDLGCGNGALTSLLYDSVSRVVGVDFSEYLISVAQRDFQKPGQYDYLVDDANHYLKSTHEGELFNKVLLYGCFAYFPDAEGTLSLIRQRMPNVERVFIGNMPDLNLVDKFYYKGVPSEAELLDFNSKIGIWRTEDEFTELSAKAGWKAQFTRMPKEFYAAHYRYDVILSPA